MRRGKRGVWLLLAGLMMVWLLTQSCPLWAEDLCPVCGVDLAQYSTTKFMLTSVKNEVKTVCSIYCAAWLIKEQKFKKIETVEYTSGEVISAKHAYFVVGSATEGGVHPKTRLAFIDKPRAAQFASRNGGFVKKYEEVMENMLSFLEHYRNKIPKILKTKDNTKCFTCHEATKGRLPF